MPPTGSFYVKDEAIMKKLCGNITDRAMRGIQGLIRQIDIRMFVYLSDYNVRLIRSS